MERKRLPDTRQSITKKINVVYPTENQTETLKIYVTVGLYDDGRPGEVFLRAGKAGSMVSGLLDTIGICISVGLQAGIPIEWYISKLRGMQFEPAGHTGDPEIPRVTSIVDAIARWMENRFAKKEDQ